MTQFEITTKMRSPESALRFLNGAVLEKTPTIGQFCGSRSNVGTDRELCDGLLEACSLLQDMRSDLSRFDGDCLLMNSAMTKVYAALKPSKLIIYDGRVGAALGLLARHYLHSIKYDGALPEELQFPWGKARGVQVRDPSDERFKFPQLFGQRKDMLHAEWMRRTSDLLRKVAITVSPSSSCSLASLERALFMIGYDVSGSA